MNIRDIKGMTLIEILVATLIFTLALGALLEGILAAVYLIDVGKDQSIANSDLISMMERIRVTPFSGVTTLFPVAVVDGPAQYPYPSYLGGYSLNNEHITVTYADEDVDPLEIKANLTWRDKRGRSHSVSLSTFKTR